MKNTDYIDARNMLLPIAEKFANDKWGTSQNPGVSRSGWVKNWGRAFLGQMNKLAREQKLIK